MISSARNASSTRTGPAIALLLAVAGMLLAASAVAGPAIAGSIAGGTSPAVAIPAIAPRVAAEVASRWSVPADRIRLQWGRDTERIPPDASFRLLGKGADGWFALSWKGGIATTPLSGAVRIRAGCVDTLYVAARPLDSGGRIADGDIRAEIGVRWGPPASLPSPRPGRDWEIRRPLATGDVVAWPAAVPPPVILKGEEVRLEWQRGDVLVSLTGISLDAARMDEDVRVRVPGRRLPLIGKAIAPGRARLVMGGNR